MDASVGTGDQAESRPDRRGLLRVATCPPGVARSDVEPAERAERRHELALAAVTRPPERDSGLEHRARQLVLRPVDPLPGGADREPLACGRRGQEDLVRLPQHAVSGGGEQAPRRPRIQPEARRVGEDGVLARRPGDDTLDRSHHADGAESEERHVRSRADEDPGLAVASVRMAEGLQRREEVLDRVAPAELRGDRARRDLAEDFVQRARSIGRRRRDEAPVAVEGEDGRPQLGERRAVEHRRREGRERLGRGKDGRDRLPEATRVLEATAAAYLLRVVLAQTARLLEERPQLCLAIAEAVGELARAREVARRAANDAAPLNDLSRSRHGEMAGAAEPQVRQERDRPLALEPLV